MKKNEFIRVIIVFVIAVFGILLFLSKATTENGQDYFEGKVIENTNDYLVVQIDVSYEELISMVGETIQIEKSDIVQKRDFSQFSLNERIRVLYKGIDSKSKKIEHIFALYKMSEIQQ